MTLTIMFLPSFVIMEIVSIEISYYTNIQNIKSLTNFQPILAVPLIR